MRISAILFLLLSFFACKEDYSNPFEQVEEKEEEEQQPATLDPNTIGGLHANVFGKTCANSGCHDGTFEPDFRTVESTYNTLVLHPIIKNDPQGSFQYRVLPGNADQSQLIARLTYDIDGNSGIMPLVIDPDSDWLEKREEYIENVKSWINEGAKDLFGNDPGISSMLPQMAGVAGKTSMWIAREENKGALLIPASTTSLELYIALRDDETPIKNLSVNQIKVSLNRNGFEEEIPLQLELLDSAIQQEGYEDDMVPYYHKIAINPQDYGTIGQQVYFRVYVEDEDNPLTEIPSDGAAGQIKDYFSFIIVE